MSTAVATAVGVEYAGKQDRPGATPGNIVGQSLALVSRHVRETGR
jgi:hypothetical protein